MFDLNPLAQSGAWWQHLLMLLGAGILGYVIGYRKSRRIVAQLEDELHHTNFQLNEYRSSIQTEVSTTSGSVGNPETFTSVLEAPAIEVNLPVTPDDLKKIEGIGPKIEQLLNQEKILTFRHLSQTSPEDITSLLRTAGPRFQMHDPASWPRQASLAADDRWEELKTLQSELKRGRTV